MKKIVVIMMVALMLLMFVGCGNKDMFDTVYAFDYAIVSFPDGTCEKIKIKQWTDYDDGEQIQIKTEDGTTYLVHAANCVLVNEP